VLQGLATEWKQYHIPDSFPWYVGSTVRSTRQEIRLAEQILILLQHFTLQRNVDNGTNLGSSG
jgi:hypothetical protein